MKRVSVLTLLTVLLAGAAVAQTPQAGSPAAPAPVAPVAPAPVAPAAANTDAVEPQGFTYDSEGRRDPFVSLLRRGSDAAPVSKRGSGLAGLGTAEVSLRGTVRSQGTWVGILEGADSRTYIVRAGDKLSDGSIRSITADSMVILQQVNDPLSLQQEQEVRKLLRQMETGK